MIQYSVLFCTQPASLHVFIPDSYLPSQTVEPGKDSSLLSLGPCPCTEQGRNKTPMGYGQYLPMHALDAYEEGSCTPQLFGFMFSKWCFIPYLNPYLQHFSPYLPPWCWGLKKTKVPFWKSHNESATCTAPKLWEGTTHIFPCTLVPLSPLLKAFDLAITLLHTSAQVSPYSVLLLCQFRIQSWPLFSTSATPTRSPQNLSISHICSSIHATPTFTFLSALWPQTLPTTVSHQPPCSGFSGSQHICSICSVYY